MIIKGLVEEDFANYKKPSMFIIFPTCTFKCEKECGVHCCQNSELATSPNIEINVHDIVNRYVKNPITNAIVIGGLEPFDSLWDLELLIQMFRKNTKDDIVIYTGYTENELESLNGHQYEGISILKRISKYSNIIIKFGRYIPNQESHFDETLGVELASPNQYARRIS